MRLTREGGACLLGAQRHDGTERSRKIIAGTPSPGRGRRWTGAAADTLRPRPPVLAFAAAPMIERDALARYIRQARFAPLGTDGQAGLARARVVIVGCGALGSVAAELLARAGVRALRLIDRDAVDASNLHRVALYTEADASAALPKAEAAAGALLRLRADLDVEARVADLDGENALELLAGCDLVLDGSDNFEARHVLNEACLALSLPWIHGACLGATAVAWPILPGAPCYACEVRDVPSPGETATCETAGILGSAVHLAASIQVVEGIKILAGRQDECIEGPWTFDAWRGTGAVVRATRDPECPACAGEHRFLGKRRAADAIACGRGGVQLASARGGVDLDAVAARLPPAMSVTRNRWLVRLREGDLELTVFRDGRVLVAGTRDVSTARAAASRWLGG